MALSRLLILITAVICIAYGLQETSAKFKTRTLARFSFQDSTYELVANDFVWDEAKYHCKFLGMDLASIETQEEQDAIRNMTSQFPGKGFWISGNDRFNYDFVWESTGKAFLYTKWAQNQPRLDDNYDCVYVEPYSANWSTYTCNYYLRSICESPTSVACTQCPQKEL